MISTALMLLANTLLFSTSGTGQLVSAAIVRRGGAGMSDRLA